MRRLRNIWGIFLLFILIAGCSSDNGTVDPSVTQGGVNARFDPTNSIIPFPNNLLFSGSTDGTLNIPVADPNDLSDPQVALNALDGFSTVAPISTGFSGAIDDSSIEIGKSVRIFEVTLSGIAGAVTGITKELTGSAVAATVTTDENGSAKLILLPLSPLTPKTSYMIVLTKGIKDTFGKPLLPDTTYAFAKSTSSLVTAEGKSKYAALTDEQAAGLEPLRQLTNAMELTTVGSDATLSRDDIILSWTFTTESITDELEAVKSIAAASNIAVISSGKTLADLGLGLPGIADIYVGTIDVPYYLDAANPLTGYWHTSSNTNVTWLSPMPQATSTQRIPILMTIPNTNSGKSKPTGGWPVVIFLHGITQDRTNLLGIAATLAQAGYAGVAIDLPLHGITDTSSPFYQADYERTYNLDFINNDTGQLGPDGKIDPSGQYFINLKSLLTTRDNVRQGVSDLFTLAASLPSVDYDGGGSDFNPGEIQFVGHSLGAIVGGPFLALDTEVKTATLASPGGGLAMLLQASPTFGPVINDGLGAEGVAQGSADYEAFFIAAQTVVDSGDPINYAIDTADYYASKNHPIYMTEVVGGGAVLSDQVIPNSVATAPLSGTEPLARIMNLTSITSDTTVPTGIHGIVRFTQGSHSSLLDPEASSAATIEMQAEMAGFIGSGGTIIHITDPTVIQQ